MFQPRLSATRGRHLAPLVLVPLMGIAASPVAAEPPRSGAIQVHRVEPGETVWRIARRYGSSVESIMTRNGLRDVRQVPAGRTLTIPVEPPASEPEARVDAALLVRELERVVQEARFEETLRRVEALRERLGAGGDASSRRLAARIEVLAATAQIAFGRREAAIAHFARALAVDPELSLDPEATSPKLLSVFQAARILAVR